MSSSASILRKILPAAGNERTGAAWMETMTQLMELDLLSLLIGIFMILSALVSIFTLVSKFLAYIGRPLKWIRGKDQDHALLLTTASALSELQKKQEEDVRQSIRHDKEIKADLENLLQMFLDKEIDDWRWEILDFASALSSGRQYSKEQFTHVFAIFEKYEQVLETNNLTNGQTAMSMEVINEIYKERLKNGFATF